MNTVEQIITKYFSMGLQQKEIMKLIELVHGIHIHPRTLKRKLKKLNLHRRKYFSHLENVVDFMSLQLETSGHLHGYRWMHLKCIQNGLVVTQETVRELLKLLDPKGVNVRQRKRLRRRQYSTKGPNSLWHVDSYDKLKPYGICINGAIDGFSRNILWLRAGRTASDPKVIAGYFVQTMEKIGGHPQTIRSDMGTENGTMEKIQKALVEIFSNEEMRRNQKPPFLYGRSTANQRIECWWSILRKHNAQYWINLFETLRDEGYFNGTFLDKSLIQFCFLKIVQEELEEIAFEWNTHKIRRTRNCRGPTGRPFMMYEAPSLYDTQSYLIPIPSHMISMLKQECTFYTDTCDEDIASLCKDIIEENQLNNYNIVQVDDNKPYNATKLYVELRSKIYDIIADL